MLRIILSASNAMAKWLRHDFLDGLPRMPSPDGKRIGTQPLTTDGRQISWQCHVINNRPHSNAWTVIATEAYSRYTLLIPYSDAPSLADFEKELLRRWANDLAYLCVDSKALTENDLPALLQQFIECEKSLVWYRNTDMSVNGHVADAEQWVSQMLAEHSLQRLGEEDAFGLGDHINKLRKRAKKGQGGGSFYPVARFLDDGLFRFANGLAKARYPHTAPGNFPSPYPETPENESGPTNHKRQLPDNVVYLAAFRKQRS